MFAILAAVSACSDDEAPPARTPLVTTTAVIGTPPPTATTHPSDTTRVDAIAAPPVAWTDCGGGFECGSIVVPLDYAQPNDATVRLPLIRLPAGDASSRIGSLVMNPGGPGASGVDFVRRAAKTFFTPALREHFDIVGFDPRGVGGSDPAVDCTDDLQAFVEEDPSPDSPAELEASVSIAKELAQGCALRSGVLLSHVSTADVARDMDVMRRALGDEKLTYAGFSYGTLIGALYADSFPTRIRSMVLDGAVDPSLPPKDDVRAQIVGFEQALDSFLADCSTDAKCAFHSGGNAGAAFDGLMASVDAAPLKASDGRAVGPGLAWLGVAASLYDQNSGWPALARALSQARDNGDGTLLARYADSVTGRRNNGSYDNEMEQRVAVNCVDFPHLTPRETSDLLADLAVAAPRFGKNSGLAAGDPCDYWSVPPQRVPARVTAAGAPPILVVGTTGDPATPFQQAVALAGQLRSGVLFTYRGEGHTAYGKGVKCVDNAVDAYLIELSAPGPDAGC